ncbi:MAG: imidazole glycerol phosphate synthase subunit HisH [Candidatus Omnitrophica bacterium CG1_02_40_15]|nr:MAG: imidazole glycerol phosphate synthase subunit HisH [Candidatus Omnitrophica bacterium CG1_02_40_15]
MITIIDYGMGNLRSVQKAFEKFCSNVIVSSSAKDILKADKVILPGVGAFKVAMDELKKRDLIGPIKDSIKKGKPFLGICLGMQLLFSESEEGGRVKGLDIIEGKVRRFKERYGLKIPHMGWNKIRTTNDERRTTILDRVEDGSYMYFVHSYYAAPKDKDVILCETDYGGNFTSGVRKGNVYGFQFHPEKSQSVGLKIIENFVKL